MEVGLLYKSKVVHHQTQYLSHQIRVLGGSIHWLHCGQSWTEPQFISLNTSKWPYDQRLCYFPKSNLFWDTLYYFCIVGQPTVCFLANFWQNWRSSVDPTRPQDCPLQPQEVRGVESPEKWSCKIMHKTITIVTGSKNHEKWCMIHGGNFSISSLGTHFKLYGKANKGGKTIMPSHTFSHFFLF